MKYFLLASLSCMLLSTLSGVSANAQSSTPTMSYGPATTQEVIQLSPFDLATFAYRGHFKNQGISGYGTLIQDHFSGKVSNRDIVQAAIAANLLPESTLNNVAYLSALDNQLRELNLH
jgi:hypothetical protein